MIRAVLDANVLLSGMLSYDRPGSKPGEILRRVQGQTLRPVLSRWLIDEIAETLAEPYFQQTIGAERCDRLLSLVQERAEMCEITANVQGVAPDPDDDPVIATALSGGVRYLVTGDKALRRVGEYGGVSILTPSEFLALHPSDPSGEGR